MSNAAMQADTTQEWSEQVPIYRSYSHWTRTVPSYDLSQWKVDAIGSALRLRRLKNNWDSYGSPPPSGIIVDAAIERIRSIPFEELPTPQIVPVAGGGIQLEWSMARRDVELEILPDGHWEYLKVEGGESIEEGEVESLAQFYSCLAWLAGA